MPLLTTEQKWIFDNNHSATYEALAQPDPSQPEDAIAAGKTLEKYQARIAAAASKKFDAGDIEDERHEGCESASNFDPGLFLPIPLI